MNGAQFKDPVSHICLAGTVVASWSLTQEVADSSPFNDKISKVIYEYLYHPENFYLYYMCVTCHLLILSLFFLLLNISL